MRNVLSRAAALALSLSSGCTSPPILLVEQAEERDAVELSGEVRESITPPFPATRRFEVDLPASAILRFAPALVATQNVRRARVSFRVIVEAEGEASTVFDEVFRFRDANRWHDRELDLSPWAGQRVVLRFVTRTPEDRADILWADRLQPVWGAPVVVSSRRARVVKLAEDFAESTRASLRGRDDVTRGVGLMVNLVIAGLLALVVRKLFSMYAVSSMGHSAFESLFPLFTLTTVLVIVVVQSSLALSLGLIGALSIVRFRTAVKTPEEIVYLLFCVAVGVALGADQRLLAIASVSVIALFLVARHRVSTTRDGRKWLLTLTGEAGPFFEAQTLDQVRQMVRELQVQRLDREGDRVEVRAIVSVDGIEGVTGFLASLCKKFPMLQFSFVDADDV